MADEQDWAGVSLARHDDFDDLSVIAVIEPGQASWGSPFRALGSDGNSYFVKTLGTCARDWAQGALAIEYVVAQVGKLIGAPVCDGGLIRVPTELAGHSLGRGATLHAGIAHASKALATAEERRGQLAFRHRDHNGSRHVGIYALYDWCFGDDPQWLHDVSDDQTVYSHDHGLYFPPHTGEIRPDILRESRDEPNELPDSREGLHIQSAEDVAQSLEKITRDALVEILRGVPASWPVSDEALVTLGWFLEHRAPAVADRIRNLVRRES